MVGNVEGVVVGAFLEAFHAAPSDVLEGKERAVGGEDVVELAAADPGVVQEVDDVGEDAVLSGAEGLVGGFAAAVALPEDIVWGALRPVCWRRIDRCLDVRPVEVDLVARWVIIAWIDDAEMGPDMRACVCDVIDVEAGVAEQGSVVDIIEDVAGEVGSLGSILRLRQDREVFGRRWERQILLKVRGVVAVDLLLVNGLNERIIQVEQV